MQNIIPDFDHDKAKKFRERKGTIRIEFGKLFRNARDKAGISRADLAYSLDINPHTIAHWEARRCFLNDLSLITEIYEHIGVYIPDLLHQAVTNVINRR